MERIWHDAPAAALHVWDDAHGRHSLPNAAAAAWAAANGIGDADWQALAADMSGAAARLAGRAVGLRRVALDGGGTLLWLQLPDAAQHAGAVRDRALDLAGDRTRTEALDASARLVVEAMGLGFWSYDVDSGAAVWDAQMCRIYGMAPEMPAPHLDEWIVRHVHPSDQERVRHFRRHARADIQVMELTFRARDDAAGGERWVQSWTRRTQRNGRSAMSGMHLDVSARQREQAQAQHERERAAFAIEAADVGVWERTLDGRFGYWNDAMYRLRGLAPGDPRPLAELARLGVDGDDAGMLDRLVIQHMGSGEPLRHECRVHRPDGSQRWLLLHGRAMRDGAGALMGMAGIDIDITERREAEALRQEVARADAVRRDKSAFLARVSHELRTPMNAVLGFTHLIDDDRSEKPTPRQRARLQRIADAGRQMMALVDDLLELASLDAGVPVSEPVATPLAAAVHEVLETLAPLAQTEGVALRASDAAACGAVEAEPRRLVQLLTQLVTHALRAQRRGGHVEIACRRDAHAWRPMAIAELRAAGPGYTEAEAATLFEPFLRHGAASASGAGTGLSLALAQRLAQAMGGDIVFDNGGRVIQLRLPLGGSDAAPAAPARGGGAAGAAPASRSLRVLCVEDNPVNLLLVRELLALRPAVVLRVAVDGASAVEMALAEPPDVLLLDLQLPDISGTDVLLRLRNEAAMAGCVYVALSADAMPEHIARARAAGFDDYWTKPIEFDRFLAGIDRLAARAGGRS